MLISYEIVEKYTPKKKIARCKLLCDVCLKKNIKTYKTTECFLSKLSEFKDKEHICNSCKSLRGYDKHEKIFGVRSAKKGLTLEQCVGYDKALQIKQQLSKKHKGIKIGPRPKNWIHPSKGKTYEEIYGEKEAQRLKRLRSEQNPGISRRGQTYEEIYGLEKAIQIKEKRKNSIVIGAHLKGKAPSLKSGNGYSGHYKGHFFRSFLELSFMINFLERNNLPIISAEYIEIPYYDLNNNYTTYRPDFICNNTIYELKPKYFVNDPLNTLKAKAAQVWATEHGYNYQIITEKDFRQLTKGQIKELYLNHIIQILEKYDQRIRRFLKLSV